MDMRYSFEELPSCNGYQAVAIHLRGFHVATLLHLRPNQPTDWRVFRKTDWAQIQPWEIFTMDSQEDAKAAIQSIDTETFKDKVDPRSYALECETAYGQKAYIHIGYEGYPTLRRVPEFMTYQEAGKLCMSFKDTPKPWVIGSMTGGDHVVRMSMVQIGTKSTLPVERYWEMFS